MSIYACPKCREISCVCRERELEAGIARLKTQIQKLEYERGLLLRSNGSLRSQLKGMWAARIRSNKEKIKRRLRR